MSAPRKRRRRRSPTQLVAARTLIDIKQRKLAFLREVSAILSDALGFTVKVSLSKPDRMVGLSPDQRRAARMTTKQARRQIIESAFAPFTSEPE
jgi:hypothetical protein